MSNINIKADTTGHNKSEFTKKKEHTSQESNPSTIHSINIDPTQKINFI